MGLQACNVFWLGGSLSPIERACFRSFVTAGQPLRLFTYGDVDGIPEGVELRDANEVIPLGRFHDFGDDRTMFSDLFRLEIQRCGLGYWVDSDVYCIKPLDFMNEYVYGWSSRKINNAVLKLPTDSTLLQSMLDVFKTGFMPPWLKARPMRRFKLHLHRLFDRRFSVATADFPWGIAGPSALTYYIQKLGLEAHALPREAFYPVPWYEAGVFADPEKPVESLISKQTYVVHLWNNILSKKNLKHVSAPSGSFLHRLQQEGA